MKTICFLFAALATLNTTFAVDEDLAAMMNEYASAVSASGSAGFSDEAASNWIDRLSAAIDGADDPNDIQSGLVAVMSLKCWLADWDGALQTCDRAYLTAASDDIRLARLLDRFEIAHAQANGVGPHGQGGDGVIPKEPRSLDRELSDILNLVHRMQKTGSGAFLSKSELDRVFWSAEKAASVAIRNDKIDIALDMMHAAMELIGSPEAFPVAKINDKRFRYMRSKAAVLALRAGDAEAAVKLVRAGRAVSPGIFEVRGAYRLATDEGAIPEVKVLHDFVTRASKTRKPSRDSLALLAEHGRTILQHDGARDVSDAGEAVTTVGGVDLLEVIALLEHEVDATELEIVGGGTDYTKPAGVSRRQIRQTIDYAHDILASLYRMVGDPVSAAKYNTHR